jgi:hypothetical protein
MKPKHLTKKRKFQVVLLPATLFKGKVRSFYELEFLYAKEYNDPSITCCLTIEKATQALYKYLEQDAYLAGDSMLSAFKDNLYCFQVLIWPESSYYYAITPYGRGITQEEKDFLISHYQIIYEP